MCVATLAVFARVVQTLDYVLAAGGAAKARRTVALVGVLQGDAGGAVPAGHRGAVVL